MQSFIIKVRRGDRNGHSGGHAMKKIRLNKSQLQKSSSSNSDRMIQVISEISDLIKFNGMSKLASVPQKNIVKYRTNVQPRTLSQIQNLPNSNVVTSITNIEPTKVKNSISSCVVPPLPVNQVRSVNSINSIAKAPCVASTAWSASPGTATITVGNIQPKTDCHSSVRTGAITVGSIQPKSDCILPSVKTVTTSSSGICVKSIISPHVVTSQNNTKAATIFTTSSIQRSSNSLIHESQPHYTIKLKTTKNSIGSPTITSTSFTPIKPSDSKPPSLNLHRPQPIFIRKDLSVKENSVSLLNDVKNDDKSDWDEEDFDEDFDDGEVSSAPIRTFCVSTGSCKSSSRPCLDAACYNRYNKHSKLLNIASDASRSQKINVIGKSSFVPVNLGSRCQQSETGKKVDEVIEEILSLEESQGIRHVDSASYHNNDVLGLGPDSTSGSDLTRVKLEEPHVESEGQMIAIIKERQKKDNHNMIERRRRFNINDRIKELATLLPKTHEPYFDLVRDLRHNKGEILKASVDYIRRMKSDLDASKESDAKRRALEQQNRQLHLKIQELEARLRQSGINVEETTLCPSLIPSLISADCQPQSQQMLKTENVKNSITPRSNLCTNNASTNNNALNVSCANTLSNQNFNSNDTSNTMFSCHFNVNISSASSPKQNSCMFNDNNSNITQMDNNCSTSQSNNFPFESDSTAGLSTCNNSVTSKENDCNYNSDPDSDFSTINLDAMDGLCNSGLTFNPSLENSMHTSSVCSPRVSSSNLSPIGRDFLSPDHYSAVPDHSPDNLDLGCSGHNTPTSNYSPNMHDDQFSSTIVDHNLLMPSSDLLTRTLTPDDITREALTRDALSSDDLTPDDLTPLFPASDHLLGAQCNDASSKSHYEDTTCHYDDTSCHYEDNTCNDRSSDSLHNDNRKELLQDLNAHPFELDLMEDDPVSGVYSCDPLFSSPQVPSTPYDSPSSLHESLSPDSMDIVS
ncbi:probable serine/threonine-protein kinase DDB_G0282963 isoform X2 [Hyalella azteca]|uniref:Probable serine/threonine-protein kinase DDB_G0282963 isoform X2 n=1 Tax=Hyalella azteca TaxID=294128 RepID=A0A8B7NXS8_HYAAZ|nr:probable serine/threonine-protein kinase DDB_G0282963 isoform X2 [Hyalella azteca]